MKGPKQKHTQQPKDFLKTKYQRGPIKAALDSVDMPGDFSKKETREAGKVHHGLWRRRAGAGFAERNASGLARGRERASRSQLGWRPRFCRVESGFCRVEQALFRNTDGFRQKRRGIWL